MVKGNADEWVAVVEIRHYVSHRATLFFLEQLILKHDAAPRAIRITQMDQGIDFFFAKGSHGFKFVDFLRKVALVKIQSDKQLLSCEEQFLTYNFRFTLSVEICPICPDDLIILPRKVLKFVGYLAPLVICEKVSNNNIVLMDPVNMRQSALSADIYWAESFVSLLSTPQLDEYIIFGLKPIFEVNVGESTYLVADAQVACVSDFGKNGMVFTVQTHLGHILSPGDYALGYDLRAANINDSELNQYENLISPDVILIKKSYEKKPRMNCCKPRAWKFNSLCIEIDDSAKGKIDKEKMNDEQFLRDLEENPELRSSISLYQNEEYKPLEMASVSVVDEAPSVPLDELLTDLDIRDVGPEGDDKREGSTVRIPNGQEQAFVFAL